MQYAEFIEWFAMYDIWAEQDAEQAAAEARAAAQPRGIRRG